MDFSQLLQEVTYKAVRSSGSGGQHINKTATKVELYFDLFETLFFTDEEKSKLKDFFKNRISKEGILILSCGETRSQLKNKNIVTKRFLDLIQEGLKEEKDRITTKIPRAAKRKRLANKKKTSEKKANRKPPKID
ncbi:alternative ribosome rescue aminoacyl-tRNA hydrolase ArfB [Winogradskyella sp.]|uniref:alternative ribosome rescue aminoacyl-tRNA hydrolase ArfB n=1 Tax=Winogradskyella sp. TaxID=1883156 RepID=UPI0025DEBC4A|nr:alternative ribosome rescue aminoacyl-tRNA hydrolase ArfB [Winogradskyella sp.]MBT8245609.1 aminoacyl-tRNA hydrolase [Winogradskyella sp.]